WRVQARVDSEDWDAAVGWANVGMAFGADLCGGSMADATIGYSVMDGVRKALAPYIGMMPIAANESLAQGTTDALARMPDASVTIHNESLNVLESIKELQDAHKSGKLDAFAEKFHGKTVGTVRALKDMQPEERSEFFKSLVAEARSLTDQLLERIATPGAKRGPVEDHLSGSAKEVFVQFAAQAEPWMAVRDREIARMRLLLATTALTARVGRTNKTPDDLSFLGEENSTDPYTGYQLGYISYGRDFVVYSYGIDGKDDRGDTNAAQTDPDLVLEDALH
ncbi:MAG TPA: hypothetical protein VNI20_06465, partial [Fimbriimonadaceae bacterium]|nr:hypothetical protein [Fimbriimonadaceae bacterium]